MEMSSVTLFKSTNNVPVFLLSDFCVNPREEEVVFRGFNTLLLTQLFE